MKKLTALLLCLCMAVSLAAPAFATEEAPLISAEAIAAAAADVLADVQTAPEETETAAAGDETPAETEDPAPAEQTPAVTDEPAPTDTPADTSAEEEQPAAGESSDAAPTVNAAFAGSLSDTVTWDLDEKSDGTYVLVVAGTGAMPDYSAIGSTPWFAHYTKISEVIFGAGITHVGSSSFANCTALTTVKFETPSALKTIGDGAFYGCSKLSTITFPDSLESISTLAFRKCTALTDLGFPEGVKTLEGESFSGCTGLKTLSLPLSLISYGDSESFAFEGCTGLVSVAYGGSESTFTANLGRNLFSENVTIAYADLPVPVSGKITETITWEIDEDYVLTIAGTGAMPDYDHSSHTPWANYRLDITAIHIGEGITHVGDYAFDWCSNVTETTLPDGLVSIGEKAFGNGATGTAIEFPSGLETIGDDAFHMNKLTAVHLPESVTSVGDSAFAAGSIKDITLPNATYGEGAFANNSIEIVTLEEGHKAIPDCISKFTTLKTLHLPSTMETLEYDFLAGNTGLETVSMAPDLDASHTFLGWQAENGTMFTNDHLVNGNSESYFPSGTLTAVWVDNEDGYSGTLEGTDIRWAVEMSPGVLTISGTGAMPDFASMTEVPWMVFSPYVTKIVVEEGVTTIGANSFSTFLLAFDITLPEGLETIGDKAFYSCKALTDIDLPSTIKTIGDGCFYNCTALETVTVADPANGTPFLCWVTESGDTITLEELIAGEVPGGTLTAFRGVFTDVSKNAWFYDSVMLCYEEDIMKGTDVGLFEPYGGATRAQVVTVLYRLAGEPEVTASAPFSDVAAGSWFHDAVVWAANTGVAKGYEDGTFAPYNYVTREEFLVFLHRFTESLLAASSPDFTMNKWSEDYDLADMGYTDAGSISSWALEAETWSVLVCLQAGYDNGDDTYSLNPRGTVTRAELATFLARYYSEIDLYIYAEVCQLLLGYPAESLISVFGGEPDDKLPVGDEDREIWYYDSYGVALLIDYSTYADGVIIDWAFTNQL